MIRINQSAWCSTLFIFFSMPLFGMEQLFQANDAQTNRRLSAAIPINQMLRPHGPHPFLTQDNRQENLALITTLGKHTAQMHIGALLATIATANIIKIVIPLSLMSEQDRSLAMPATICAGANSIFAIASIVLCSFGLTQKNKDMRTLKELVRSIQDMLYRAQTSTQNNDNVIQEEQPLIVHDTFLTDKQKRNLATIRSLGYHATATPLYIALAGLCLANAAHDITVQQLYGFSAPTIINSTHSAEKTILTPVGTLFTSTFAANIVTCMLSCIGAMHAGYTESNERTNLALLLQKLDQLIEDDRPLHHE